MKCRFGPGARNAGGVEFRLASVLGFLPSGPRA
jgi:hypothetical protein